MEREMLQEIAKRCKREYGLMNEIYANTKELGEAISRDDRVSIQLILAMRQEAMDKYAVCERELKLFIESLLPDERNAVEQLMKGAEYDMPPGLSTEGRLILDLSQNLKKQIKKTVELDRVINVRLAGKDSFYSTGK